MLLSRTSHRCRWGNCPVTFFSVSLLGYNPLCCCFGSLRLFLPEIPAGKEDRCAPFQYAVIDSGMGQIGRVLDLFQFQVRGDDQRFPAPVPAVNDREYLLHGILGAALHAQVVNDQQAVIVQACKKSRPVLGEHTGKPVGATASSNSFAFIK